jgi:hypothetical protein
MTFGYYCNLNCNDEDLFSFELIIYVSTVAKGPEIVVPRERVEWVHRRALVVNVNRWISVDENSR